MDLKENYKNITNTQTPARFSLSESPRCRRLTCTVWYCERSAREREKIVQHKNNSTESQLGEAYAAALMRYAGDICCGPETQKKLYIWECRRSALDKIRGNDVNEKKVVSDRRRLSSATRHNDIFRDIVSAREGALWWWRKIQNINCRWSAPTTEPENIYAYCTKSAEQLK